MIKPVIMRRLYLVSRMVYIIDDFSKVKNYSHQRCFIFMLVALMVWFWTCLLH